LIYGSKRIPRLGLSCIAKSVGVSCPSVTPVDNLWTTLQKRARLIHILDSYLTRSLPSSSASERLKACSSLRRLAVVGILCLFIGSQSLQVQPAQASQKNPEYLKLYAHSIIMNEKQYLCFSKIIFKESRWDHKAVNGSHYGLGQMRSQHYRTLDPFAQLRATLAYITKRYGSSCKAWEFHKKKGHY
jgi:hypothetical protein